MERLPPRDARTLTRRCLATTIATALLLPLAGARALEFSSMNLPMAPVPAMPVIDGLHGMTEDELAGISAQGLADSLLEHFADRLFKRTSVYLSHGNVIATFGGMAAWMNPVWLLDEDSTFRDVTFNPANSGIVIDKNGTALIRLPSAVIQGVDLGGTMFRVTPRH